MEIKNIFLLKILKANALKTVDHRSVPNKSYFLVVALLFFLI